MFNEEHRNLYSSLSAIRMMKSRRMRWVRNVARFGEKCKVYRLLIRKPEGKRPLGIPRHRWVDIIRMDFGEIERSGVDLFGLVWDRLKCRALVTAVMNLRVP
jgi:hypothetical protein